MLMSEISTYCQVTTTLIHFFWCWLFVDKFQMTVFGVALSLNVTYISCYFAQEFYYRIYKRKKFNEMGLI